MDSLCRLPKQTTSCRSQKCRFECTECPAWIPRVFKLSCKSSMMNGPGLEVRNFPREPSKRTMLRMPIGWLRWRAKQISKKFRLVDFRSPTRKRIARANRFGLALHSLIDTIGFQRRLPLVAKKTSPNIVCTLSIMN